MKFRTRTTTVHFVLALLQYNTRSALAASRPNILLLLTDDQDVVLGSFDHMPNVRTLIQNQGLTFDNAFVHTPICCPSRSSILTGRYLHNGVARNNSMSGNCYGNSWKESIEPKHTYAVHAHRAGYTTAYAGKYLNMYGRDRTTDIPPGWDHWLGLVGNSRYYNYTLVEASPVDANGNRTKTIHKHGDDYATDYLPNVLRNHTVRWLSELPEPWLMVVAWPTPHGPFTPAPWAVDTMSDIRAPVTKNYNASDEFMQQKHWLLRQLHPLSNATAALVDHYYQRRLEALKSVDEHVGDLVDTLNRTTGQLDDTVIVYASDNGFQFGQHRLALDKRHLYETDIRVPFAIRGPNIAPNTTSLKIVANIDIAPTIVDIAYDDGGGSLLSDAKVAIQTTMDGSSFWKYVQQNNADTYRYSNEDPFARRRDMLISYNGEGYAPCGLADCPPPLDGIWWMPDSFNNTYHCVRTLYHHDDDDESSTTADTTTLPRVVEDTIYCRFDDDQDFVEFYDLRTNPHQLQNDVFALSAVQRQRYEHRLHELLHCHGVGCRADTTAGTTTYPAVVS